MPPKSRDSELDELRHLIPCDNVACGRMKPPMKCGRCKIAYYCSKECQKSDWKHRHKNECVSLDMFRAETEAVMPGYTHAEAVGVEQTSLQEHQSQQPPEFTSCGICLEEAIAQPVTLPCRHIFCFSCLCDLQERSSLLTPSDKTCPLCRTPIGPNVIAEALNKANVFLLQSNQSVDPADGEKWNALARMELNKVLAVDPTCQHAILMKARASLRTDPWGSLRIIEDEFQRVGGSLDTNAALEPHVPLAHVVPTHYRDHPAFQVADAAEAINQSLLAPRGMLARSYEAVGQYDKACHHYKHVLHDLVGLSQELAAAGFASVLESKMVEDHCGLSRCYHHLGRYEDAIYVMHGIMNPHRDAKGTHKLVAMPLLAMAERDNPTGTEQAATVYGYQASLAGAIEVMYKGVVYESQWDEKNKQTNRAFLQELCDKAAGTAKKTE